jgi:hypothetical protein
VLDAWVKGSVLSKGMMYLEDTINRRQSHKLTLDTAGKGDARVLAGPTDDGWYHIQVEGQMHCGSSLVPGSSDNVTPANPCFIPTCPSGQLGEAV